MIDGNIEMCFEHRLFMARERDNSESVALSESHDGLSPRLSLKRLDTHMRRSEGETGIKRYLFKGSTDEDSDQAW